MPDKPSIRQNATRSGGFHRRWWNTLAFRLGVTVNATVIAVLALSAWIDHRRDTAAQIQHALTRLQEESRVLRAAWSQFRDPRQFQEFVDRFCQQMTPSASPGHHIALFDASGRVLVRAHERADTELEQRMKAGAANNVHRFALNEEPFASYSLGIDHGATLVVAVSLQPVQDRLRVDGLSRAMATGILVLILFGVTTICLLVWVRDPLRRLVGVVAAVGEGRFDERVEAHGAAELQFLADGVSNMVQSLGRIEHQRASEMERARQIQRAVVGSGSHVHAGYRVRAVFLPTETVGGDLFDVVPCKDGSTVVAVIDVTGHGVPAALCTALLRSSLRHLARSAAEIGEIARGVNQDLCDIAAATGVFATAAFIKLGPDPGTIEYANAGHDPPLLIDPRGRVTSLNHAGLMLGVDPQARYASTQMEIEPKSRLFLFTDGLHEAMSAADEQFGRGRLARLFAETRCGPLEEQITHVVESVRTFRGQCDFDDDVTILGIEWATEPNRSRLNVPLVANRG